MFKRIGAILSSAVGSDESDATTIPQGDLLHLSTPSALTPTSALPSSDLNLVSISPLDPPTASVSLSPGLPSSSDSPSTLPVADDLLDLPSTSPIKSQTKSNINSNSHDSNSASHQPVPSGGNARRGFFRSLFGDDSNGKEVERPHPAPGASHSQSNANTNISRSNSSNFTSSNSSLTSSSHGEHSFPLLDPSPKLTSVVDADSLNSNNGDSNTINNNNSSSSQSQHPSSSPPSASGAPSSSSSSSSSFFKSTWASLKELSSRGIIGEPTVELEPIVELGLNAEQLVDSLALLSRTFGHLLNQSGYSGPLEAALNDQLNKLERIATTQLALAKKEERVNLLGRQYIDKLQRRLAVEEKEFAALVVARKELEEKMIDLMGAIEDRITDERLKAHELFETLKILRDHNERLIRDQFENRERIEKLTARLAEIEMSYRGVSSRYVSLRHNVDLILANPEVDKAEALAEEKAVTYTEQDNFVVLEGSSLPVSDLIDPHGNSMREYNKFDVFDGVDALQIEEDENPLTHPDPSVFLQY